MEKIRSILCIYIYMFKQIQASVKSGDVKSTPSVTRPGAVWRLLLLGGSWVVISRAITRVTILITLVRGLITPLITTPEPPSTRLLKTKLTLH